MLQLSFDEKYKLIHPIYWFFFNPNNFRNFSREIKVVKNRCEFTNFFYQIISLIFWWI